MNYRGNWTAIIDHNTTRYEQNVFHIDTDKPDFIDIKLTHSGFTGQLRFKDEALIESGALDQIVFNIEGVNYDVDDINDVPFEDSFRQYVCYFPISVVRDDEDRRTERHGWITPTVRDQDTLPLIFKPPTMQIIFTTILDDESVQAESNFKVVLGMILTGQLDPPLPDVKVSVQRMNRVALKDREPTFIRTDQNGRFRYGPTEKDDYEVIVSDQ